MTENDSDAVTLHDASACFSEEEWDLLQEWQKELCRNVMKEIQRAVVSLGPLIATTVSSFKAKDQQRPACTENLDSRKRHNFDASFSDASSELNKSFNPKQPQTLHVKTEQREINPCLSRDKEADPIFIDHLGEEVKQSSTDTSSGIEMSFSVKDEEEPHCMDLWDSRRKESVNNTNTDDGILDARKGYGNPVTCNHQSTTHKSYAAELPPEVVQGCIEIADSKNKMRITSNQQQKGENNSPGESGIHHRLHSALYQRTTNHKRFNELSKGPSDMRCVNTVQPKTDTQNVNIIQPKSFGFPCWPSYSPGRGQTFAPNVRHVEQQRMHSEKVQEIYMKCEKTFSAQPFKEGSMTHAGDRPYQCTICRKSFNNKGVLQRHQIIHTGERPYECSICGKRFGRKGTLVRHQIIHLKDRTVMESESELQ